jgi:hypothetical protein
MKRSGLTGGPTTVSTLLILTLLFVLPSCGSGTGAESTSTSVPTATLPAIAMDAAPDIAESIQSILSAPTWTGSLVLIPRGTSVGSIETAASLTLNRSDAQQVLRQNGYENSSTSTFAIERKVQGSSVLGGIGLTFYDFSDAKGAMEFFEAWQGQSAHDGISGIKDSSFTSKTDAQCGSNVTDCFGGFVFVKAGVVVDGGFNCSIDCSLIAESVGASVYRALG